MNRAFHHLPARNARSTPRPAVRLAVIIKRLPDTVTVEGAVGAVNRACGIDSDDSGPDVPSRTYSWSEIYRELREQGFMSVVVKRELIPGALWSAHLIPAFRRFTYDGESA